MGQRKKAIPPMTTRMSQPAFEPDQNIQAKLASVTPISSTAFALRVELGNRHSHARAMGNNKRITPASVFG